MFAAGRTRNADGVGTIASNLIAMFAAGRTRNADEVGTSSIVTLLHGTGPCIWALKSARG
jgi:hypothetical protein